MKTRLRRGFYNDWWMGKITTPSGLTLILVAPGRMRPGVFKWGTLTKERELTPEEAKELHRADHGFMCLWAKGLPKE